MIHVVGWVITIFLVLLLAALLCAAAWLINRKGKL